MNYRADLHLQLVVRECDDGVLVFDGFSRTTHLISHAAWKLFDAISRAGNEMCSPPQMHSRKLRDELGASRELLDALEAAGFVHRC